MKPIHRSEGVWFRQWALFQKNKNHVLRSEILMMKVAIANMPGTKWVNYSLMDETFYKHWQYRFIRLCQKTHPFVLYVSTFYSSKSNICSLVSSVHPEGEYSLWQTERLQTGVLMRQKQNENNFILSKVSATGPSKKKKRRCKIGSPLKQLLSPMTLRYQLLAES